MHQRHYSTTQQRVQMVSELIAQEGRYGVVSQMSQHHAVSRQTLYSWKGKAEQALQGAFAAKEKPREQEVQLERAVLTFLTESHASYRGIQVRLETLLGLHVSWGVISRIVQQAGQRAKAFLAHQRPQGMRALALDEQYGSQRGEAYLNIVDVHRGLVLASVPPVAVDGESWTLLLWQLQEQGVHWKTIVSDGGRAIQDGVEEGTADQVHQRDVWHVEQEGHKVQARLDRAVHSWEEQARTVARQAERLAKGQKPRGAHPNSDVQAHAAHRRQVSSAASGLRSLSEELKRLLEVVVLAESPQRGVLSSQEREQELEALLALWEELWQMAPAAVQGHLKKLWHHVQLALPHLLSFTQALDMVQQEACQRLGPEAVSLIGWAGPRRGLLGPTASQLLVGLPHEWQESAAPLLWAWEQAVRASSVVENWQSVLRPFLAVHRRLSADMLAILAVWHNHRVAPRGLHKAMSPMQRSELDLQATDWLLALGYAPASLPGMGPLVSLQAERQSLAAELQLGRKVIFLCLGSVASQPERLGFLCSCA